MPSKDESKFPIILAFFVALCYIGIVHRVRQQNKKSIAAKRKEKLEKSRRHENRKILTPPNSPIEGKKILSSLEVDVALDPSPLAFAPWSLEYLSKNQSSLDSNSEIRSTSVKITIDNKQDNRIPQTIEGAESESSLAEKEKIPSIPTLSISFEESSEKNQDKNETVQVEVHRQDVNHLEMEMNNEFRTTHSTTEDSSENKHYLKLPSVLFG